MYIFAIELEPSAWNVAPPDRGCLNWVASTDKDANL